MILKMMELMARRGMVSSKIMIRLLRTANRMRKIMRLASNWQSLCSPTHMMTMITTSDNRSINNRFIRHSSKMT